MKEKDQAALAAIFMALHEYAGNNVHDVEPGVITLQPHPTLWNAKFLSMTPKPAKK